MPSADRIPKNPRTVADDAPGGPGYWAGLVDVARGAGLDVVGVTSVEPLLRARDALRDRVEQGHADTMRFTFGNPERSTTPAALVEGARSIIVAMMPYAHVDDAPVAATEGTPVAVVARYARRDHVEELKARLGALVTRLRLDGHRAVVFADDNSIVDREVAWRAGLGWFGKNSNILVPGTGSWFVIGCIVTTADLPEGRPVEDGCGACTRCIPACPTDAIVAPGTIDARRCLSWLLQKPGVFPHEHRTALGNRIYGCDDCQTSCPVNRRHSRADGAARGAGLVDVLGYLALDDGALDHAVEGWWVHERNMEWVRRNLLVVLGNIGAPDDPGVVAAVERHLASESPVLRAHALWAAARLGLDGLVERVAASGEGSAEVREELVRLPPLRPDL